MSQSRAEEQSPARRDALWHQVGRRCRRSCAALSLFVAGVLFWAAFDTAMEATNTEEFCVSCHEMRDNVYPEYKKTAHYTNRTGVRATCADCHVPRPWVPRIVRKLTAADGLLHKLLGTLDSKEKFAAHRVELAQRVWRDMAATDSRECRNCHSYGYMDLEQQVASVQKNHSADIARESGKTCIDCHKGLAHGAPQAPGGLPATMRPGITPLPAAAATAAPRRLRSHTDWAPAPG